MATEREDLGTGLVGELASIAKRLRAKNLVREAKRLEQCVRVIWFHEPVHHNGYCVWCGADPENMDIQGQRFDPQALADRPYLSRTSS